MVRWFQRPCIPRKRHPKCFGTTAGCTQQWHLAKHWADSTRAPTGMTRAVDCCMRIVPIFSKISYAIGILTLSSGCSGDAGGGGFSGAGGSSTSVAIATGGVLSTGGTPSNGGSQAFGGNAATGGVAATGGSSNAAGSKATTGGASATGGGSAVLGSTFACAGNTCVVGQSYCFTFVPTAPGGGPVADVCEQLPQACINTTDCACVSQAMPCGCTATAGAIQVTCSGPG